MSDRSDLPAKSRAPRQKVSPRQAKNERPAEDARSALLRAALALFAAKGYSGVSIRDIAQRAGVNSALITYHFGGKDSLFAEVFRALARPINEERLRRLNAVLCGGGAIEVDALLAAWIRPIFQATNLQGASMLNELSLGLRTNSASLANQLGAEVYHEVNELLLNGLQQCLPSVSRASLVWRLMFLVGAVLTATRPHETAMQRLSGGTCQADDNEEMIAELVSFTAAGMHEATPERVFAKRQRQQPGKRRAVVTIGQARQ